MTYFGVVRDLSCPVLFSTQDHTRPVPLANLGLGPCPQSCIHDPHRTVIVGRSSLPPPSLFSWPSHPSNTNLVGLLVAPVFRHSMVYARHRPPIIKCIKFGATEGFPLWRRTVTIVIPEYRRMVWPGRAHRESMEKKGRPELVQGKSPAPQRQRKVAFFFFFEAHPRSIPQLRKREKHIIPCLDVAGSQQHPPI